jgi:hypothetical protein
VAEGRYGRGWKEGVAGVGEDLVWGGVVESGSVSNIINQWKRQTQQQQQKPGHKGPLGYCQAYQPIQFSNYKKKRKRKRAKRKKRF